MFRLQQDSLPSEVRDSFAVVLAKNTGREYFLAKYDEKEWLAQHVVICYEADK